MRRGADRDHSPVQSVQSAEAEASSKPSGENGHVSPRTAALPLKRVAVHSPVRTDLSSTVQSPEAEASCWPLEEKTQPQTTSPCP